ncbi:hypothetical protein Y032_0386g436 [Ancylostoma ceylanicum]|uniref:Methyltransferase type 11 domain-containing protein n=1 Tax=Ancylostoma ceylanicum TaxID=53326 RepID=A0A016RSH3_9BILA|nr:hypothetical protein Y032_0386g436 [Ancylostoma ceylanicum]
MRHAFDVIRSIEEALNAYVPCGLRGHPMNQIGMFDFIILNEMTHEVPDMAAFFRKLKVLLKDNAPIVVLSRPKNPPLPVPECCLMLWRKLAPTREEVQAAVKAVGF